MSPALLWGLLSGLLFGLADVITRVGVRDNSPITGAIITSLVVFLIFAGTVLARGLGSGPFWPATLWFLLMGVCATGPGRLLYYFSFRRIGVSRASVLIAITPLFSILIAVAFLEERPSWPLVVGAVLIVIGIINIAVARPGIRISPLAALLGLSPALFYSLSPVFIRLGMVELPDRIFGNTISALGAVLFMLAMPSMISEENRWSLNRGGFPLLLVAGVVYTLAFFAYFAAVEISSVSFATPLVYTMSLFSALISRILFQEMERITWRVAFSAVAMFMGVALISMSGGG